jgi:hypothetical protein
MVAGEGQRSTIPQQQVEWPVLAGCLRQRDRELVGPAVAAHEIAHQPAAGARSLDLSTGAHVRHRGQSPVSRDLQPASAGHQVTPAIDPGGLGVEARRSRGPPVELVAVGDQDQRIPGVALPGEGDQAHGEC